MGAIGRVIASQKWEGEGPLAHGIREVLTVVNDHETVDPATYDQRINGKAPSAAKGAVAR